MSSNPIALIAINQALKEDLRMGLSCAGKTIVISLKVKVCEQREDLAVIL